MNSSLLQHAPLKLQKKSSSDDHIFFSITVTDFMDDITDDVKSLINNELLKQGTDVSMYDFLFYIYIEDPFLFGFYFNQIIDFCCIYKNLNESSLLFNKTHVGDNYIVLLYDKKELNIV